MNVRLSQRGRLAKDQPISLLMSRALENPQLISLAAGFVDQQSLPTLLAKAAIDRVLQDPSQGTAALQYGTTEGDLPLRRRILDDLLQRDGVTQRHADVDQMYLTAGSNQLLHLVAEALLDPGDIVLCAAPTYLVFLGMLQQLGARAVGVPVDAEGMSSQGLARCLVSLRDQGELSRVKAIYLVSYFDNPRGVNTSLERRREILELAQRYSLEQEIFVIEDLAYRELRYECEDMPSLLKLDPAAERVVLAGTFSKSFSPGIRVGWGLLPRPLLEPVRSLKGAIDFGSPHFNQRVVEQLMASGDYDKHVREIQSLYATKLAAMLNACDEFMSPIGGVQWTIPQGGLYVWLTLPPTVDAGPIGPLFDRAIEEGVLYVPGEFCYPPEGEPVHRNTIRLSFGVQTPDRNRQGIRSLARAIAWACEPSRDMAASGTNSLSH